MSHRGESMTDAQRAEARARAVRYAAEHRAQREREQAEREQQATRQRVAQLIHLRAQRPTPRTRPTPHTSPAPRTAAAARTPPPCARHAGPPCPGCPARSAWPCSAGARV